MVHIRLLEILDEMGVRPYALSGCSMGAVIGALYASGHSGREIREIALRHYILPQGIGLQEIWSKRDSILNWAAALLPQFGQPGLIHADRLLQRLLAPVESKRFEDLSIPLSIVATDFWEAKPYIFREGPILPALHSSIAFPGIFEPYEDGGRMLVDGGLVNELPYDLLPDDCDIRIAFDVVGNQVREPRSLSTIEALFGAFQVLQRQIRTSRLEAAPPDLLIQPHIPADIEVWELAKIGRACDGELIDPDAFKEQILAVLE